MYIYKRWHIKEPFLNGKVFKFKTPDDKKTQNIMIGKAYGAIETMPCPLPPSAAKSFSSFVFSGTKLIYSTQTVTPLQTKGKMKTHCSETSFIIH